MEHVHEQIEVLQALCRIIVALHIVALPEGIQVVIVDRIRPIFILINVARKLFNNRLVLCGLLNLWQVASYGSIGNLGSLLDSLSSTSIGKEA